MSEFKDIPVRLSPNKLTLSDSELQRIGQLIYRRAGIVVNAQKREMIFNRLSRRLRALGIDTFLEYISILESRSEHPEWQNFVNALTTNLTSFFRETYHFPGARRTRPSAAQRLPRLVYRRFHRGRTLLHRHDAGRDSGERDGRATRLGL